MISLVYGLLFSFNICEAMCIGLCLPSVRFFRRSDCGTMLPELGSIRQEMLSTMFGSDEFEERGREQLTRLLMAYTQRNPIPGYVQGMNYICSFMLIFLNEEQAFWTFCALIEDVRLPDFYSHSMNGLKVTVNLLVKLIYIAVPRVALLFSDPDLLELFTQLIVAKLLISCFVNFTNVATNLMIWDQLFAGKSVAGSGEVFLVYACLAILRLAFETNPEAKGIFFCKDEI